MSKTSAGSVTPRPRPLSPHLTVYKWPATMLMSILHRITGGALYFGTLLLVWWLLAAATSRDQFDLASGVLGSWFGLLVLVGFTWALSLHLLGGVRHLIWDTGTGLEKDSSTMLAWATLAGSFVLTAAIWLGFLLVGA
jgi:succinate dehydrogenase / fumarate reductase, cytochrome b subunit